MWSSSRQTIRSGPPGSVTVTSRPVRRVRAAETAAADRLAQRYGTTPAWRRWTLRALVGLVVAGSAGWLLWAIPQLPGA